MDIPIEKITNCQNILERSSNEGLHYHNELSWNIGILLCGIRNKNISSAMLQRGLRYSRSSLHNHSNTISATSLDAFSSGPDYGYCMTLEETSAEI